MMITQIVIGWYKRSEYPNLIVRNEVWQWKGDEMFEMDSEKAKEIVAKRLGYNYADEIDFRFFDRSCWDETEVNDA